MVYCATGTNVGRRMETSLVLGYTICYPFMPTVHLNSSKHKKAYCKRGHAFDWDPSVQQTETRRTESAMEESGVRRTTVMIDGHAEGSCSWPFTQTVMELGSGSICLGCQSCVHLVIYHWSPFVVVYFPDICFS